MDSAVLKNAVEPRSVDPVWTKIREAAHAAAAAEPVLAGTLHATILSQPKFEGALSYHLARLAGTTESPSRRAQEDEGEDPGAVGHGPPPPDSQHVARGRAEGA